MMNAPFISVVVPAYNCERTIAQTLQAIQAQTYPHVNIIVVDDGSSDATASIVQSFADVKYVHQENSGPASARNRGAQESADEFIFFTDSDCVPDTQWIERMMPRFQDQRVSVVAGSYGIVNEENILARCIHKEILFRHHHLMPSYPKAFGSYNFGVRRKVFEKVGGFDTQYREASGEDNDLSYKLVKTGGKIYFEKKALVGHFHPEKVMQYLQEQCRHGFWRVKMYADHPSMLKGDDYTFWKDVLEVPISLFLMAGFIIGLSGIVLFKFLWGIFLVLIFMEFFYGYKITHNFSEGFILSSVMVLRSFSRTIGLSSGALYLLFGKFKQKS